MRSCATLPQRSIEKNSRSMKLRRTKREQLARNRRGKLIQLLRMPKSKTRSE